MAIPPFNLPDAASIGGSKLPVSLSDLTPSDRLKHHRKVMRSIGFNRGLEGVNEYKAKHPEAGSIRVDINTLAYSPKPKGYDHYLTDLVGSWLGSDTALASTNLQDVARLNAHFNTSRFNPAQHFSEALSESRLAKIKAVFAERGVGLDTVKATSLSKVRKAAKAFRAGQRIGSPNSPREAVEPNFVIGDRAYPVAPHHGHDCIRVSVGGRRVRIRTDALAALIAEVFGSDGNGRSIKYSPIGTIRELAPDAETALFDALADEQILDVAPKLETSGNDIPDMAPDQSPLSFTERIAALKAAIPSYSPTCPDGVDPLAD